MNSGLAPERLELEIIDTSLIETNRAADLQAIRQLRNIGVSIVLDDCGVGYSSAGYLAGFPFDKVKIGRSVMQGVPGRRECVAVVSSVLALAHSLDIVTVAKGVESSEQFDALLAAGIDFAQGYLFGRPVSHGELDLDALLPLTRDVA